MQVNITLFFQIINFLIAYWFLNIFFFKPVFNFINKKKTKEKKVLELVGKKEHVLLHLEEEKYRQLVEFRQDIRKKYLFEWKREFEIPTLAKCKIDKSEMEKMAKKVESILVKRIPHVD